MASVALSTRAPVVRGGPVTRAIAAVRGGQDAIGLGCIILADGPVFFEAGPYPREGDSILVAYGDGRIEVATMPARNSHWRSAQTPNVVMIATDKPYGRGVRVTGEEATLIGVVRV